MRFVRDKLFSKHFSNALEKNKQIASWDLFKMVYETKLLTSAPNFTELISLKHLKNIDFLPHQVDACKKAMHSMHGRVILADEVGLGKTIEAGLILKEYLLRGLIKRVLILVPASLVNQWVHELQSKFYINATPYQKNYRWEEIDIVISSIDTAKRESHRKEILDIDYDLLIVDEAHKLKNSNTQNFQFVKKIKKKYCLLLTATPVQNDLLELYNLVTILKPGLLGSIEEFSKKKNDKRRYREFIQNQIQKVMIRNTRKETNLNMSERKIKSFIVNFSKEERELYNFINQELGESSPLAKLTYLREVCSSKEALYLSLTNKDDSPFSLDTQKKLSELIQNIDSHSKGNKLIELLQQIGDEKVIVFTEYRGTQLYLQWLLQQHGISSVPFRGGFNPGKKDWMKQLFEQKAQVLIATEAAGEGINLQFCNHLVNYDLPWNPMRLEQRIGRIHRFGQNKDVHIYNFAIKNTIEERILKLLYEKIELFETVIGKLDHILSDLNMSDLDREIKQIFSDSTSNGELEVKLNNLTNVINSQSGS